MKNYISFALFAISPLFLLLPFGMDMYLPVLPEIKVYFGVSDDFVISLTVTLYMILMGAGQLFFGPLADTKGRKTIALTGCVLFILGSITCLFSSSILMFIAGRVLQAIGGSACFVSCFAILRDFYDGDKLTKALSYVNGSLAISPVVAPSIGAFLTIHNSWHLLFIILCIAGVLGCLFLFLLLPETLTEEHKKHSEELSLLETYKTIISNKVFVRYTSLALLAANTFIIFLSTSSILLINVLGEDKKSFGFLFAMVAGIFMIGSFTAPELVIRYGAKRISKIGATLIVVGAIIMFALSEELTVWNFIAPFLICSAGATLVLGSCPAGALEQFPDFAGTAASVYTSFSFGLGAAFVTLLINFSTIDSVKPILITIGASLLLITTIYILFGRERKKV